MRLITLLSSLLILTFQAQALPPVKLNVVAVSGKHALSDAEIFSVIATHPFYTNQLPMRVKLQNVWRMEEITSYTTLDTRIPRLYQYIKFARAMGLYQHGAYLLFIVPPIEDGGKFYWAGLARTACSKPVHRVAWATGSALKGSTGATGINLSNHVFNHEFWHLLGAFHDDTTVSLMNSNALIYVTSNSFLPVSEKSKRDVRKCQLNNRK